MTTTIIISIFFIGFVIWVVKFLEKNLPKRDERIRKEYQEKLRKEKNNKDYRYDSKKVFNKEVIYLKADEVAKHFKIKKDELYKIINTLNWSYKSTKKGWIATSLGESKGGKHGKHRGIDYIHWDSKVLDNFELISAVDKLKNNGDSKPTYEATKINQTKKEKGDKYEAFIANFFKEQGYYVWEHGKEKGVKDSSIDLFVKKDKFVYFIQCKDWENWKINDKEVKATRTDVREYLKAQPEFWNLIKTHDMKILYVTSKACLAPSAYKYIEENQEVVEHQVIPMSA